MPTITKTFHFAEGAEGWAPNSPDILRDVRWVKSRGIDTRDNDVLHLVGGCLKHTAKANSDDQLEASFTWTGTFEDLGVPSGVTVTSVKGDYQFRFIANFHGSISQIEFPDDTQFSGPFILTIGVSNTSFSNQVYAPARGPTYSSTLWKGYPSGDPYEVIGSTQHTEYPIVEIPSSWEFVDGDTISVDLSASDEITLTLSSTLQAQTSSDLGTDPRWIAVKQDRVVLNIEYASPGQQMLGVDSLTGVSSITL